MIIDLKYTAPPTVSKFMRSDAFHRAIMGPIGSGKSVGCCIEILRRCSEVPAWNKGKRSSRGAIIRNTVKQLEDTTLKTWMHWMADLGWWMESKKKFFLKVGDIDAEILFLPLDRPGDEGRVLSLELTWAWVNEFREIPISLQTHIKGRLKRYPNPKEVPGVHYWFIADTNPPEIGSDAYNLMEHLPQEEGNLKSAVKVDAFKQPSGISDEAENRDHLADDYYEAQLDNPEAWVNTYIHGQYSPSMSGKPVYIKTFKYEKHVSSVPLKVDQYLPVIISFDCGLTPAARFAQLDLMGRIRVLREAVEFDMGMKRFAKYRLRPIIKNYFPMNPLIFIGDPAGVRRADSDESSAFQVLKKEFSEEDAIVKAASTNDPKLRIDATDNLFRRFPDGEPVIIIDPVCKWYIEALRSKYRYLKFKLSGGYSTSPEKNDWSHIAEAGQYGDLYLQSGKYDASEHIRAHRRNNTIHIQQAYRPAQAEGY